MLEQLLTSSVLVTFGSIGLLICGLTGRIPPMNDFFWIWLAWRENHWPKAVGWFIAIILTGNIAMAAYLLIRLFKLPPGATAERLLLRDP